MRKFLHSIAVQNKDFGADGIYNFDLAVNPLSALLIALRPLNDTGTLANVLTYFKAVQALNSINVSHMGRSIFRMSGADAAAMAFFKNGIIPMCGNGDNVDNERRCFVLPILFGRWYGDPENAIPQSRRGELTLEIDVDDADTGYDDLQMTVEMLELPGANPKAFERKVSQSQTFAAVGDNDVDLSPGWPCRGILCWGTTAHGGASPAPSWGRMQVLLDNEQAGYAATDFEVSRAIANMFGRIPDWSDHKHTVNAAGAGVEETTSTFDVDEGTWANYTYLDMDFTRDDAYTLNTKGKSRFSIRATAETADAVRAIPVEVVDASEFIRGGS
jgi:hypothetical protein